MLKHWIVLRLLLALRPCELIGIQLLVSAQILVRVQALVSAQVHVSDQVHNLSAHERSGA